MWRIASLLAVTVLIAAGCGSTTAPRASGQPRTPTTPSTTSATGWITVQADVIGIHRTPTSRAVRLDVQVPAGQDHCARNPRVGNHTDENNRVYANIVVDTSGPQVQGNCPTKAPGSVTLTSAQPIGTRELILNYQVWTPEGPQRYRMCATALACDPPADHCDSAWITAAAERMDAPRHASPNVQHCEADWMVMTRDFNAAQCGAEPRPACSATSDTYRYYFRFAAGWQIITRTRAAGCASVLAREPAFPRRICAELPAVS